jgi:hypothetical protein
MCTQVNFTTPAVTTSQFTPVEKGVAEERVSNLMQQVIEEKDALVQSSLKNRMNATEAVQIGGDLFSMGYLAFQGAQIVKPSLAAIPAIAFASLTCGVIAGAINIGVAIVCLKEGIQASKNGDTKLATRLYIDFACLLAIGVIMMLTSIAVKVAALGALTAFFATNPWLLPVIFFILSIPIIVEVAGRIKNIWQNKDLASQLKTPELPQLIHGTDEKNPFHLQPLIDMAQRGVADPFIKRSLSEKMEQFQANMGVEASLETFRLMRQILRNEEAREQLEKTKKKIAEWNNAQYVRMAQQALYTAAFGVSMAALSPRINIPSVNGAQTFAMAAANAIPLYMDTFWPFKRNTPVVVPMVS